MVQPLCVPCRQLVIKPDSTFFGHHLTLSELESCAQSIESPCPVCRVFWDGVTRDSSTETVKVYLYLESRVHITRPSVRIYIESSLRKIGIYAIKQTRYPWAVDDSDGPSAFHRLGSVNVFAASGMLPPSKHSVRFKHCYRV